MNTGSASLAGFVGRTPRSARGPLAPPLANTRESSRFGRAGAIRCGAGTRAQCHILFPGPGMPRKPEHTGALGECSVRPAPKPLVIEESRHRRPEALYQGTASAVPEVVANHPALAPVPADSRSRSQGLKPFPFHRVAARLKPCPDTRHECSHRVPRKDSDENGGASRRTRRPNAHTPEAGQGAGRGPGGPPYSGIRT
jgi:hypothetical protein